MHIAVVFYNVGGYHAARLRAAHQVLTATGGHLSAIQQFKQGKDHPWGDMDERCNFPLFTLSKRDDLSSYQKRFASALILIRQVKTVLNELDPDAVAVPGWGSVLASVVLRWCRRAGKPAILMSESKYDDEPRHWWRELAKTRLFICKFSSALVGGRAHRDYLIRLGMSEQHVFLGYDAIDNSYFAERARRIRYENALKNEGKKNPEKPYFLAVTRFIARKNLFKLIQAYTRYRSATGEQDAWDLAVCGSGPDEQRLRATIRDQGVEASVHLPGFLPYDAMPDWYGMASAFIHPALQEQWGLVVNEACAAGLPVLCSRTVGACAELVQDKKNGLVFDPFDMEDIAKAMINVHRMNEDERVQMGRAGQAIVADWGPERFAQGLLDAALVAIRS